MKKYQNLVFSIVLFLGVMSFSVIVNAAEVIYLEGRVKVQTSTDIEWKSLEKGMEVNEGDAIKTARNSFVDIALDEAKLNTIRIGSKAMVVLNSEINGKIDRLDISKGKVIANLEDLKAGMDFEINTPSAIAGVRGSSYSVYVERDSDEILAYKDTVFLKAFDVDKNQLKEIMIPEGFKTFVERFGAPSALIQITTQEFERFDNIMEDVSSSIEGKMNQRAKRKIRKKRKKAIKKALYEGDKSDLEKMAEQGALNKDILDRMIDIQELTEDRNKIQDLIDQHGSEHSECEGEQEP